MIDTWGLSVGGTEVLLALVDSGIQMYGGLTVDHPDLDPARFRVTHKDAAGVYVSHDLWKGDVLPIDTNGHGTKVAGILAATGDTGGMAGELGSDVFVARVLDDDNNTCVGAVEEALDVIAEYARDRGISRVVVNLSLGSTIEEEVESLQTMIDSLDADTFLLCCAPDFWKDGATGEWHADHPSAYAATRDHVISVGESDVDDKVRTPFETMTLADAKSWLRRVRMRTTLRHDRPTRPRPRTAKRMERRWHARWSRVLLRSCGQEVLRRADPVLW
jgi:hypothetical protein